MLATQTLGRGTSGRGFDAIEGCQGNQRGASPDSFPLNLS